jgi:hypothetical protein
MYSVPESFLEIEVRNPQTHGMILLSLQVSPRLTHSLRLWQEDVHRLRNRLQGEMPSPLSLPGSRCCLRRASADMQPIYNRPISQLSNCATLSFDGAIPTLKPSAISLNTNQPESTSLLSLARSSPTDSQMRSSSRGEKAWRGS